MLSKIVLGVTLFLAIQRTKAEVIVTEGATLPGASEMGWGVSISGNGTRAILSTRSTSSSPCLYKLENDRWIREMDLPQVVGVSPPSLSVSLNMDGTRALIGGRRTIGTAYPVGTALVYKLVNNKWEVEAELVPTDEEVNDGKRARQCFGFYLSLSSDGNLALVAETDDVQWLSGSVYIFRFRAGTWSLEAKLEPDKTEAYSASFGVGLAISADGSRILIGAPNESEHGVVYEYTHENGDWYKTAKLFPPTPSRFFGWGLSISADGRRALVGSHVDGTESAFVFYRSEEGWTHRWLLHETNSIQGASYSRSSLSISADGNIALVGARYEDPGAAYLFKFSDESWKQEAKLITTEDDAELGRSVSLTADGSRALICTSGRAIVWEFKFPTSSPTTSPTSTPTSTPTKFPSTSPTSTPTKFPSTSPTSAPTKSPSTSPTRTPTKSPSTRPSRSPTSTPTSRPSLSPSTSIPSNIPSTSPTMAPESDLSDSDILQTGLEGSLHASEACSLDDQCISGVCSAQSEDSFICTSDPARPIIFFFAFLLTSILIGIVACICCDIRRSKIQRKASKARAEVLKAKTTPMQESPTVDQSLSNDARRQVNDILLMAIEARRLVTSWPSDLTPLEIQAQVMDMVWRYELEAYTLMISIHDNKKETSQTNTCNMTMASAILKACGSTLITVCDQRIGAEQAIESVLRSLNTAASELAIPPDCDDYSSWDSLFLAGYKDPLWGLESKNFRSIRATAISLKPAFASEISDDLEDETDTKKGTSACNRMLLRIRTHKLFYFSFFLLETIVLLSWLGRINTGDEQNFSGPPGGFGNTFLPVPPQYNFAKSSLQPITIPIVFGFMHCALVCLSLLPLPFCRGFWRDITSHVPWISDYIPVDDFEFVHRALGFSILGLLLFGAFTWLFTMGSDCLGGVEDSCLAFDPKVETFVNPIENVAMLRILVLLTWFPLLPLIYWARSKPPSFLPKRSFIRLYWYEVCLYTHISVAMFTLFLALVARFQVFFPVILPWSLYFADSFRESVLRRRKMVLVERKVFSRAENGIPTSMHLKFKVSKKEFPTTAGQWLYLQDPSIDRTWHPFSILNESSAEELELFVGICASSSKDWHRGSRKRGFVWRLSNPTWTYKLYQSVTRTKRSISVNVRGPYGSKFSHCFDSTFGGSVLIGAGSGLTAALSILRETVSRRIQGQETPSKVWFVWSCRKADDLLWCWELLTDLVFEAASAGLFEMDVPSETSTMFDWLGVAIYVTQSSPGLVEQFAALHQASQSKKWLSLQSTPATDQVSPDPSTSGSKVVQEELAIELDVSGEVVSDAARSRKEAIHKWLVSRVLNGSMDSAGSHITSLLKGVRDVLEVSEDPETSIAVAYCGPSMLAFEIQEAVRHLGPDSKVQFSADHQ